MYKNYDLNDSLLPTLEQIKRYLKKANYVTESSRDPRPLMSTLMQLPKVDLNLAGLQQTRILAVLGFDNTIAMPEGFKASAQEEKRLTEMKLRWKYAKMQSLFRTIINGKLFSMSGVRLTYKNIPGLGTTVVKKKAYDLTELDIDINNDGALVFLDTSTKTQLFSRNEIDPELNVVVRHNPLEGIEGNFIGSLMLTNMLYTWIKYYDYWNWSKGNEKFADPMIWAKYRKGSQPEDIAKVKAGLELLGTDSRAAFSDDVELKFLESLKSSSINAHKELINTIDDHQAISILGQTLTTNIQNKGSKAAAAIHNLVRADIMWSDIIDVQEIVNDQYLAQDYLKNYGEPAEAFPVLHFKTDEIGDIESNARVITENKANGIRMLKKEVYEKTDFTMPDKDTPEEDLI